MSKLLRRLTVSELADRVDAGESFTMIGTRPPESFESWHIESAVNVPFYPADGLGDDWDRDRVGNLVRKGSAVVICGKGLSSTSFGFGLAGRGYDGVGIVRGGVEDWSKLYGVVELDIGDDDLPVAQAQRRAKGYLDYVVGSRSARETVVVDTTQRIHEFELVAADTGMTVAGVLDTRVRVDHVSGGWVLAGRLDVLYYLGAEATDRDVAHEFAALDGGGTLAIGSYDAEAMHAPGHTLDMTNYLISGQFLLTGGTLLVESVGRMELRFGDSDTATGAELLYETLHGTLLSLPDETRVLPGHVSVGAGGRYGIAAPGELVNAPLGDPRGGLDLLSMDVSAFVARVTEDTPERPTNCERVIGINTGQTSVGDEEKATELELGPNNCAA